MTSTSHTKVLGRALLFRRRRLLTLLAGIGTLTHGQRSQRVSGQATMGNVDLDFKSAVPVFDANVALGRRHDRRVRIDTVEGTLQAMSRVGVGRALVYSPHAANFDPGDGNRVLLEMIEGEASLVPQFVCIPSDDLESFAAGIKKHGVRSVRLLPKLHDYPFRDWVVKPWLQWLAAEDIHVWIPFDQIDPSELHETLKEYRDLNVVLAEVPYRHAAWALHLLRSLPNLHIETSWFLAIDGVSRLIDAVGDRRILYGSRFPESAMGPHLYHLHRCGLSESSLAAICSGNLKRILWMD